MYAIVGVDAEESEQPVVPASTTSYDTAVAPELTAAVKVLALGIDKIEVTGDQVKVCVLVEIVNVLLSVAAVYESVASALTLTVHEPV